MCEDGRRSFFAPRERETRCKRSSDEDRDARARRLADALAAEPNQPLLKKELSSALEELPLTLEGAELLHELLQRHLDASKAALVDSGASEQADGAVFPFPDEEALARLRELAEILVGRWMGWTSDPTQAGCLFAAGASTLLAAMLFLRAHY